MSKIHTIEISHETHELLQEVKKVFVSYTGEDISEFNDDKVIEILASGFFDTEEDDEEGEGHACESHDSCACKGEKGEKKEGCCGHHH